MKVMSIIGIVWFSFSLILIAALLNTDMEAAAGWGILGLLYAIPYSIVGLFKSSKKTDQQSNISQELLKLHELKEKGILTDDEFQGKKSDLLKM